MGIGDPTGNRFRSRLEKKPGEDRDFTPHFGLNSANKSVTLEVGEYVNSGGCYYPAVVAKNLMDPFANTREVTSPNQNSVVSGTRQVERLDVLLTSLKESVTRLPVMHNKSDTGEPSEHTTGPRCDIIRQRVYRVRTVVQWWHAG